MSDAPRRQSTSLDETAHRPWPLPRLPWIMGQTWRDLLFAHWRVDPAELERFVPHGLRLDLHDGAAWLGVTPCVVCPLRPQVGLSALQGPRLMEANVRTY